MVHIIAEAGSNYNGQVSLALSLNSAAKRAGADSVKFQIIYPDDLYLKGDYSYGNYAIRDVRRLRELNVLTDAEWWEIRDHAAELDLEFTASVFCLRGLELIASMNPPYIKIASTDLNNFTFLRHVSASGLRIVLSTGMSSMDEIEKAIDIIQSERGFSGDLVVLHCVSSYPVDTQDTNLAFLLELQKFGFQVGFSDHSLGVDAAIAATALGAEWLEKHFTLDKSMEGLDHKHSADEPELTAYIESIRQIENSLRPKESKIGPGEAETMERARRGVYAARNLPAGHRLTSSDILIVRPPSEISAGEAEYLVGKVLDYPVEENSAFSRSLLPNRYGEEM